MLLKNQLRRKAVLSFVDGVEEPAAEPTQLWRSLLWFFVKSRILLSQINHLSFQHLTFSILLHQRAAQRDAFIYKYLSEKVFFV